MVESADVFEEQEPLVDNIRGEAKKAEEAIPSGVSSEVGHLKRGEMLPEGRYLLFDSGCSACADIACSVEQETEGWLSARSLKEQEVQRQLAITRPDWKWEPGLLEIEGDKTLLFTGLQMKMRLLMGLGPRKTARIARIVRWAGAGDLNVEMSFSATEEHPERYTLDSIKHIDRRTALKRMAAAGIGMALLPMLPQGVLAQETTTRANGSRGSSATGVVARVRQMTQRQARQAFATARKHKDGGVAHKYLTERGFVPNTGNLAGANVTVDRAPGVATKTSIKTWFVTVLYTKRNSRERAALRFSVEEKTTIGGGVRQTLRKAQDAEFSIVTRAGGLDSYAVAAGTAARVRSVRNIAAERRRLKIPANGFQGATSRASSGACGLCIDLANVFIIGPGCGLGVGSALALFACGAVSGGLCPIILGVLSAIYCGSVLQFGDTPAPVLCDIAGYCDLGF